MYSSGPFTSEATAGTWGAPRACLINQDLEFSSHRMGEGSNWGNVAVFGEGYT